MNDLGASQRFIAGLEQGDLTQLRAVPKADLHHHSWMGGRLAYVEQRLGVCIEPPPLTFPTDGSWFLAGARGDVPIESRIKDVKMGRESIRLVFRVDVKPPLGE